MFCFHCFLFIIQPSYSHSLRHCAQISGSWLSIWNEGGEFWCEPVGRRNESVHSRRKDETDDALKSESRKHAADPRLRSTPGRGLDVQQRRRSRAETSATCRLNRRGPRAM